jgi:hypothetical protein
MWKLIVSAPGAAISAQLHGIRFLLPPTTSAPDGSFTLANVPSELGTFSVQASLSGGNKHYFGASRAATPIPDQPTDVGPRVLREVCDPRLDDHAFPRLAGYRHALIVFADGLRERQRPRLVHWWNVRQPRWLDSGELDPVASARAAVPLNVKRSGRRDGSRCPPHRRAHCRREALTPEGILEPLGEHAARSKRA